jgi:hypothetical protein
MLLFIDDLRHIRVVRQAEAGGVREPIGRLRKHDLAIPEEVLAKLSEQEASEVSGALHRVVAGEKARLHAEIAGLPSLMRELTEFYRLEASEQERSWIKGSVQEAMRLIRRHDRSALEGAELLQNALEGAEPLQNAPEGAGL